MSLSLKKVTEAELYIIKAILESHPDYLKLEGKRAPLNEKDLAKEYLSDETESYFVMLDDTYIGVSNILMLHERDQCPWIGMLCIYKDYEGFGYGATASMLIEDLFKKQNAKKVRVGVLDGNERGTLFWHGLGYKDTEKRIFDGKTIKVMEKIL